MLIAGERRNGAREDVIRCPFDGRELGRVAVAAERDVEDAIARAHAARRALRAWPTHERAAFAARTAARLRERSEDLARGIALESGKPLRFARAEVVRAALTFELAAGEVKRFAGECFPLDLEPRGEGRVGFTLRVPRGVVAAISPFNFPLNLVAHKLAPALAVGAPCVLKPAPQCPLTALELVESAWELGAPPAGISALHCEPHVAERLVRDERVAALSFTGSDSVGWHLKSIAGKKHVLLELGGNAPCIVDETVELGATLEPLALAAFAFGGQVCVKAQRIYVHESRFAEFVQRFVALAEGLACGDPLDERTIVGPLIDERHVLRVLEWIEEARQMGARVACGARREGQVVRPTVLLDVPPSARVCRDEVFGPVVVLEPFADFAEVLERCNRSRFGLQVGLYTRDLSRALLAARELDFGGVIVNDTPSFRIDSVPYGGSKDSGLGREGVRAAMEELTEPRMLVLRGAP
ncbi:MAG: aldehyde dehydrogenase family protein [Planctomycetes bacterium]|nr:aldehyde dehydrogenase family protein [Planctomycetota bacterium]